MTITQPNTMNILLIFALLAAGAAIAVVMLAWRHIKWQAMIWLGILLTSTAGVALLLDHLTDIVEIGDVGERTATGIPLFMLGPEISILGKGWPFVFIAFLCGIALIVTSLVKKAKQLSAAPMSQFEDDLSEIARIENDLKNQIDDVQIGDPAQRGEEDAIRVGGPIPGRAATAPEGFEWEAREEYQTLGTDFVRRTIVRLKEEIADALKTLARITSEISKQPYTAIATGYYSEHAKDIDNETINRMRENVMESGTARENFVRRLKLKLGEQPEWPVKRTSTEQLLLWGAIFALIEFVVSWYFLKDQLGENDAVKVAGFAVVIIGILAFASSALFQFMRRGQAMPIRALAGAAYTSLLFMVFCGFGLLLNYRDVLAKEGIANRFDPILEGYGSMLTRLDNLALFLINLAALALFYWKTLLFFDRFHGYRNVNEPFRAAQDTWDNLFIDDNAIIKDALDHASDQSDDNRDAAQESRDALQEKKTVLENIRPIIESAFVKHLHKAYRDDIKEYRDSNCQRRNHRVHPMPEYFNQDAEFCALEKHFADDYGVGEFLNQHAQSIERAAEDCHSIEQAGLEWQNERRNLRERLAGEFQRKINDAGR